MRRILTVQQRQQIIQDLISGKRSVIELGDETRLLILSDIISSMRKGRQAPFLWFIFWMFAKPLLISWNTILIYNTQVSTDIWIFLSRLKKEYHTEYYSKYYTNCNGHSLAISVVPPSTKVCHASISKSHLQAFFVLSLFLNALESVYSLSHFRNHYLPSLAASSKIP